MSDTSQVTQDVETDPINKLAAILKKSSGQLNILIKGNPALSITLGSN
jgi:hypothetical protein